MVPRTLSCIRLKFHEDDYENICLDCNVDSAFIAANDSNQFVLTKRHSLIVGSNDDWKTVRPALLKKSYVEKHPDHKSEYIFDIMIPKNELKAISTHGFQYEILDCELL